MEYGGKYLGVPEAMLRPAPLTPTKGSASQRLEKAGNFLNRADSIF